MISARSPAVPLPPLMIVASGTAGVGVAGTSITRVIRPLVPLFLAMIIALMIVTYVPSLSLWLPRMFGLL